MTFFLHPLTGGLLLASSLWVLAVDYKTSLEIPSLENLHRVRTVEDQKKVNIQDNFVSLATDGANAVGENYTILTDHREGAYLASLEKLQRHHQGEVVQVPDLSLLYASEKERSKLKTQLRQTKYLAIAPRSDSFRENTVLALFQVLTELDSDSEIDVFPSFLIASSPEKLAEIVAQAIAYKPVAVGEIQPVAISLVDSKQRINSLQKAGYFRKFFAKQGKETPTYLVYLPRAHDAPSLGHDLIWYRQLERKKNIVRKLPAPFAEHFRRSHLVLMHGHGTVGESCRIATEALDENLGGKVVLSGSCFSAAPENFDWPLDKRDQFSDSTSFSIKALEQGAVTSFGHMRLSNGFRYLHPVFEELYAGGSNGEAYHKLLNAAFKFRPMASAQKLGPLAEGRKPIQNSLLYILLGDPALRPFQVPES